MSVRFQFHSCIDSRPYASLSERKFSLVTPERKLKLGKYCRQKIYREIYGIDYDVRRCMGDIYSTFFRHLEDREIECKVHDGSRSLFESQVQIECDGEPLDMKMIAKVHKLPLLSEELARSYLKQKKLRRTKYKQTVYIVPPKAKIGSVSTGERLGIRRESSYVEQQGPICISGELEAAYDFPHMNSVVSAFQQMQFELSRIREPLLKNRPLRVKVV
jgi:hypothetical protein